MSGILTAPLMISITPSYPSNSYKRQGETQRRVAIGWEENRIKRVADVTLAVLVTVFVLTWLAPLIALAIRLTSPGPILFTQLRTGRFGRPFRCFKFRTMTYSSPLETFRQATKNDARVTKVGRFLRKSNLDEMPQFLNVLLGDMAVVGPRPHPIPLDAQHWYTLDGYAKRYHVKPGITGLAQVRGCRGETDTLLKMQQRIRLDRFYIHKWSPWLDMKICWWTVEKMLKGDEKAH